MWGLYGDIFCVSFYVCFVGELIYCNCFFFFFNDTAPTEIYPLSPPDPLPIFGSIVERAEERLRRRAEREVQRKTATSGRKLRLPGKLTDCSNDAPAGTELFIVEGDSAGGRSEEHTPELQSPCNLVCRLLLEKK